jgi:hypothetical protein
LLLLLPAPLLLLLLLVSGCNERLDILLLLLV